MPQKRITTCRICESACGLLATVEGDTVVALEPDASHPISKGFACRKGTQFHRQVHDPDRLLHPMVLGERRTWAEANHWIGTQIRTLRERFGPESIGLYSGNAVGHSLGGVLGIGALHRGLGTTKHYSCLTLDNSEMFAVAEWVFGHPLETFVADYAGSDCLVLIGTDPLSSQPGQAQSHPDGPRQIRGQRDRLWVLDPRRSATAASASQHLQPRVGSDLWALAWLLRQALQRAGTHPALAQAVAPFDLDRTLAVTGLGADELQALDQAIATARRPLIWSGLGVLLGPHGTLGYWLTLCLQAVTGGIGPGKPWRPGGSGGLRRVMRHLPLKGWDGNRRSRIGGWPTLLDTLPSATLAEDILTPGEGQLKALIVVGGEPLRSLPDSTRARTALRHLDLLVTVGLSSQGTASLAHASLPVATWLERRESGGHNGLQRPSAFARTDRAVIPPCGEARTDWQILNDLTRAAGCTPFGSRLAAGATRWLHPEMLPLSWLGGSASIPTPRLEVPHLLEALREIEDPPNTLRLLTTVRPPTTMNHWIRPDTPCVATLHPDDLGDRREVSLRTPTGSLTLPARADASLVRGTVVVPFGSEKNPNILISATDLEPFTGQPLSNGTPVELG